MHQQSETINQRYTWQALESSMKKIPLDGRNKETIQGKKKKKKKKRKKAVAKGVCSNL